MNKIIIALALGVAFLQAIPAHAGLYDNEKMCLTIGKLGGSVAALQDSGIPEEKVLERKLKSREGDRINILVTQFIYTMGITDEAFARKIVYLKCRAGEFNSNK